MNGVVHALGILMPLAAMGAAAIPLLRCRHPRELFDRYPDGRPALRCERCLKMRPNILAEPMRQYRQTQAGGAIARPRTGIEKVLNELDRPITDFDLFGLKPTR